MRDADGQGLCAGARRHIRDLVLESGGATEAEAELLLRAVARLQEIEAEQGPEAAERAALALRRAWSSGEAR